MAKNDNLKDLLTDVADAIREKKGTTDLINPQDFGSEIRGIESGSSMWTGHVDVEGLKAIGWTDEDIAYFQKYGVNWDEEDDELHKVSEDNKALYGVLTPNNIQDYKDRIVWLPKIDTSGIDNMERKFMDCYFMKGIPYIDISSATWMSRAFMNCYSLTTIPLLDTQKTSQLEYTFSSCYSLQYVPNLFLPKCRDFGHTFEYCYSLKEAPDFVSVGSIKNFNSIFKYCYGLIDADKKWFDVSFATALDYALYYCSSLKKIPALNTTSATIIERMLQSCYSIDTIILTDVKNNSFIETFHGCKSLAKMIVNNLNSNMSLIDSILLQKDSLLYMINNEAATSTITITLHASAYARLSTDADIVEALNNHPLVTIVSA